MKKYKMTIWVELSDDAGHPEKWFYQAIAQQLNHDGEAISVERKLVL